jgi:hypothetical protein
VLCVCIFALSGCILPFTASAQSRVLEEIQTSLNHKPRFVFSFDGRNTFIAGQNARLFGLRPALDFNEKLRIGLGLYGLNSQIDRVLIAQSANVDLQNDTLPVKLQFAYLALFAEYAFYRSRHWEFGIPLALGLGSSSYVFQPAGSKPLVFHERSIMLAEGAIYSQYRVLPWLGIQVSAGYRQILKRNRSVPGNFSGPIYTIAIKVFLGKLYRSVFPPKPAKL